MITGHRERYFHNAIVFAFENEKFEGGAEGETSQVYSVDGYVNERGLEQIFDELIVVI